MSVIVTEHAIDRYIERIAPVDRTRARTIIQSAERTIEIAAKLGSHVVKLGSGGKLILRGTDRIRVVTVLGKAAIPEGNNLQLTTSPVCCGLCGLRCGDPVSSACIRTECPLGHHRQASTPRVHR